MESYLFLLFSTFDSWAAWVGTGRVQSCTYVFQQVYTIVFTTWSWLNPQMWNCGYRGLTLKLYMDFWLWGINCIMFLRFIHIVYRLVMGVSVNLWFVVKDVKTVVLYDVEWETAMDSMKGKCASSWVDLRYTNQFCVPEVTSVFF